MKNSLVKLITASLVALAVIPPSHAQLNLGTQPLYLGASIPPLVMLAMSKDQQLYKKAYNDYSDLDDDGALETTYKHTIDYYGYFDPYKCYSYDTTNNWYTPVAAPSYTTKPSDCSGNWSGNFLNWVSMSRIDAVRKLLYGGKRFLDEASSTSTKRTVIERAYIPTDAHAWAKYYLPDSATPTLTPPINQLTPFNPATTAPTGTAAGSNTSYNANASMTVSSGTKYFWNAGTTVCIGDQVKLAINASNYMQGQVYAVSGGECGTKFQLSVSAGGVVGSGSQTTGWTLTNLTATGISFCNATLGGASPQDKSQTNTNPPLIRVALGNYALWSANERFQCIRYSETTSPSRTGNPGNGATRSSGNDIGKSGLAASAMDPPTSRNPATGPDFRARVQACVTGALGTEKCKQYPDGNYKPIGLLQTYGDDGQLNFGLLTGSYDKNTSGGVLRKDISPFAGNPASVANSEVNYYTSGDIRFGDGTFSANNGIVRFLDRLRIYGYNWGDGTYTGSGGDNCNYQQISLTEGSCTSWGNPMSEIYYEGLRYFAHATPTSAYGFTYAGSKEAAMSLPQYKTSWADPLSQNNYCAPLNMLVFNASVSSVDNDLAAVMSSINSTSTPTALTDIIGVAEGINDVTKLYFVGRRDNGAVNATFNNELCDAKNITLGSALGICPEGPTLLGSFQIAGLAYHAHINKIRSDLTVPPDKKEALKINTYGIQLATNVPQIVVPVPGTTTGQKVVIQPAYRLVVSGGAGGGTLVDMKIVSSTTTPTTATGTIYVNWEDSEQGGDYDQDMWGLLRYTVTSTSATIETIAIAESTNQPQGFGYIISGTTKDGPHFHSGIEGFNYTDPQSGILGCTNCQISGGQSGWTTQAYTIGASSASALKDPLWYASKWGGFKEQAVDGVPASVPNNLPDLAKEWDAKLNKDGSSCVPPQCDGLPDNYFLVSNPMGLESALDKAFIAILSSSSAASVATNSTSLNSGSYVYQAKFNPATWSGQLLAFPLDVYGNIASTPTWDAAEHIPAATSRVIITGNLASTDGSNDAVPFRWDSISATQQAALNLVPFAIPVAHDTNGPTRLDYIRGDKTNEGAASGKYRTRNSTVLGDIDHSTPVYVGAPSKFSFDSTYVTFKNNNASREAVLYAGGNDGMLHGFSASSGTELFGFIPSAVYENLSKLTDQTYNQRHRFFVDGSPTADDVKIDTGSGTPGWRTVLVGGLNGGGRGYFALDITNPSTFSSEDNAGSILLWEFNHTVDSDLGYSYAKPVIAKMANGKMAAIVGNGYNSGSGLAELFIIYLEGGVDGSWSALTASGGTNGSTHVGTDYVKIDTGIGSTASPNGIGTVYVADYDGDGIADYVYGGDLKGNLWKFDVSSTSPTSWKVSFPASAGFANGSPLFVAKDAGGITQPITAPPEVTLHPNGGLFVYFGTGKYLETTDNHSSSTSPFKTQSVYGIWDRQLKNSSASDSAAVPVTGRSQLMVQTVLSGLDDTYSLNYRVLTRHQPNYTAVARTNTIYDPNVNATGVGATTPANQRGWYFDFPGSADATSPYAATGTGERMVYAPLLRSGRLVYTTLIPTTTPCESGGTGFLMEVNPLTGGRLEASPLDVSGDGIFNDSDFVTIGGVTVAVAGVQSTIGIIPTPTIIGGAVAAPQTPSTTNAYCTGDGCIVIGPKAFCTADTCACATNATLQQCSSCKPSENCHLCLQGKCEIKTISGSSGELTTLREKAGTKSNLRISWRELIND